SPFGVWRLTVEVLWPVAGRAPVAARRRPVGTSSVTSGPCCYSRASPTARGAPRGRRGGPVPVAGFPGGDVLAVCWDHLPHGAGQAPPGGGEVEVNDQIDAADGVPARCVGSGSGLDGVRLDHVGLLEDRGAQRAGLVGRQAKVTEVGNGDVDHGVPLV